MKKQLIVLFAFLFSCQLLFAQKTVNFGADLGFCINRGVYKPITGIDRRIFFGFDGGFLVEFGVSKNFKFQPELNYAIVGVELNTGSAETSVKLQYLTIPLLAKFRLTDRLSLLAGPQHCILLSAWNDPSGGGPSTNIKGNFKFTDLVLLGGLEYKWNDVFASVRYSYGLEQIVEDGLGYEMNNRYVSVKLGYMFGKTKK